MNILSEILGWILLIILTPVASFLAFYFTHNNTRDYGEITESQGKWWAVLLVLTLLAALVSKILLIKNIWLAIGIWVLAGSVLHVAFLAVLKRYFGPPDIEKLKSKNDIKGLIKALRHEFSYVRHKAAEALGQTGNTLAVKPLITALKDNDKAVIQAAIVALAQIRDARAIEPLIITLKNSIDEKVRDAAIEALVKISDAQSIGLFIRQLKDNQLGMRQVLINIGAPALESLFVALKDSDHKIRQEIVLVLGKIKDISAVEPLVGALKDNNTQVRLEAVIALGEIRDTRAIDPLIAALKDNDTQIRREAAIALGEIRDKRAVEPLLGTLDPEDAGWASEVASSAALALDRLGWKPRADEIGARYWIGKQDVSRCLRIGVAAIQPLRIALSKIPKGDYQEEWVPDPKAFGSYYDGVSRESVFVRNRVYEQIEKILAELESKNSKKQI